jgi:hypothetical protein
MKRIKYCVPCEIEDKCVKATKEADGLPMCEKHYAIYIKQLDKIVHEKPTDKEIS